MMQTLTRLFLQWSWVVWLAFGETDGGDGDRRDVTLRNILAEALMPGGVACCSSICNICRKYKAKVY